MLTLKPGDTLETNTLWSDWFAGKDAPWPGEVGPIAIEGAEPGDTLVVRILKIRPNAPVGRSGTSKVYGSVTATEVDADAQRAGARQDVHLEDRR